jgi:RNA polymerase sigma-70 factor (ECF subfamily)
LGFGSLRGTFVLFANTDSRNAFPGKAPMTDISITQRIQGLLHRLRSGDAGARSELITFSYERLRRQAHRMLWGFPLVARNEEATGVLHIAVERLLKSLESVLPESPAGFFALASKQIRRALLDLKRHYEGRNPDQRRKVVVFPGGAQDSSPLLLDPACPGDDPGASKFELWARFHAAIDALPEKLREVADLLWYQGLSQKDAAEVLGLDERTIKRRWQSTKLRLRPLFKDHFSHSEASLVS